MAELWDKPVFYNFENWFWKAVHSDKTVERPNYVDINRDTLKYVEIYDKKGGELLMTVEKPNKKGKFKYACRLFAGAFFGQPTSDRHIVAYDGVNYHCVYADGTYHKTKFFKDLKFKSPFIFKESLGEEE